MFSVIAFSFSIPKFLENRKIFEKNCPKISAIAAENQKKWIFSAATAERQKKLQLSSRRRRSRHRLVPLVMLQKIRISNALH